MRPASFPAPSRRIGPSGRAACRMLGILLIAGSMPLPAQTPFSVQTYTYKTAEGLAIQADVFPAEKTSGQRPVIVWIHGGALMMGQRRMNFDQEEQRWLGRLHQERGYVLVSIDYRLAPETKLPAIVGDVEDAFRWIRQRGSELFHADPSRIAVVGSSAGGYLALVTGYRVDPRPVAIVSLWGYGDLIGPWYSEPSHAPRHNKVKPDATEAWRQAEEHSVAESGDRRGDIGVLYQYCRQHGLWPQAVSGSDPHATPEKFYPFMPLKNVTRDFPPTFFVHGDSDTDVPCEQSRLMAAELQRHGVECHLVVVPGVEHGLKGLASDRFRKVMADPAEFLVQHLEATH